MIPIYFSAIFGSLFVPKLMTGLVAADLGVRIGMSLYFKESINNNKKSNFKIYNI